MVVLLVVLILVTGIPSFNYRDNVLSSLWFPLTSCLLLSSGLLSLLLTHQLDRPCLPDKQETVHEDTRRPDQDLHQLTKRGLCLRALSCLLLCLLVLLPGLLGLVVLNTMQETSPYLLLVDGTGAGGRPVSLSILSGVAIRSPEGPLATMRGRVFTDCSFTSSPTTTSSFQDSILLVNSTRPACRALMARGDLLGVARQAGFQAVVLLDNTPPSQWRVSSPFSSSSLALSSSSSLDIPLLLIREADWRPADPHLVQLSQDSGQMFLTWNDPSSVSLGPLFSCTQGTLLRPQGSPAQGTNSCAEGKVLHRNGSLQEQVCVEGRCTVLGRDCPYPWFRPLKEFSLNLSCSNLTRTNLQIVDQDFTPLATVSLPLPSSSASSYCCTAATASSSFLRVLGTSCFSSWRDVASSLPLCLWSPWVEGSCTMEEREVYRLCLVSSSSSSCVVREHRTENCNTGEQLSKCRGSQTLCT